MKDGALMEWKQFFHSTEMAKHHSQLSRYIQMEGWVTQIRFRYFQRGFPDEPEMKQGKTG